MIDPLNSKQETFHPTNTHTHKQFKDHPRTPSHFGIKYHLKKSCPNVPHKERSPSRLFRSLPPWNKIERMTPRHKLTNSIDVPKKISLRYLLQNLTNFARESFSNLEKGFEVSIRGFTSLSSMLGSVGLTEFDGCLSRCLSA